MEAIQELLSVPDVETPIGLRDRVVLEFFYSLGLRLRECLGNGLGAPRSSPEAAQSFGQE